MRVRVSPTPPYQTVSKGDYTYAVVPEHPDATENGYVLEHRYVAEKHLVGRRLLKDEIVHHINEVKKDNRPENLRVMTRADHGKLHSKPPTMERFVCPVCSKEFQKRRGKTQVSEPKCSRQCNGIASKIIQMGNKSV